MKKSTLTEDKAEKTPTGGVLVGKRQGQTIIHNKGTLSGYLVGKTHAEGGIKAVNKSTGQPLEMQGGEVVITAPAVSDNTKNEFNGKMMTNREILSTINEKGGGVSFAKGGDVPKNIKRTGESYKYGGKTMTDHEIYKEITGGHLADGMTLSQIAKKHKVSLKELQKQVDLGMKAESEHTSSKREQMKIVKDHLFENPKYYSVLNKAGLKAGGTFKDGGYVSYKDKFNKKYNYKKGTSHSLAEISKDTGVSTKGLQIIYNKGKGAFKTNPSSVRPNVKSKEQWAMARVYSAVMGGKASKVDSTELKMNLGGGVRKVSLVKYSKSGNTPARDLNNYNDVLDVDADGVVGAETGLFGYGGSIIKTYARGGATDVTVDNWNDIPDNFKKVSLPKEINWSPSPSSEGLFEIAKVFLSTDSLRPALTGINFDDNGITFTNSHILLTIPTVDHEYKGIFKKGSVKVDAIYPKYENVIPKEADIKKVFTIDILKLLTYCKVAKNYSGNNEITFKVNDTLMSFDPNYIINFFTSLYKLSGKALFNVGFTTPKQALVITAYTNYQLGKDIIGLIMPYIYGKRTNYGTENKDKNAVLNVYFDFDDNEIRNADGYIVDLDLKPTKERAKRTPKTTISQTSKQIDETITDEDVEIKKMILAFIKEGSWFLEKEIKLIGAGESSYYKEFYKSVPPTKYTLTAIRGQGLYPSNFKTLMFLDKIGMYDDYEEPIKEILSGKFSAGEIDMFNQIDKVLESNSISEENFKSTFDFIKTQSTKDFTVENKQTDEKFLFRKVGYALGYAKEYDESEKIIALINDYKEWKASTTKDKIEVFKLSGLSDDGTQVSDFGVYGGKELLENLKLLENQYPFKELFLYRIYDVDGNQQGSRTFRRGIKTLPELEISIIDSPLFDVLDWKEFINYGTEITLETTGKFSDGEIDAFNQIDAIVNMHDIKKVSITEWSSDSSTTDFDIVNTLTGEVFVLRKHLNSLGVAQADPDIEKSKALIKDYLEYKALTPTATKEPAEQPKPSKTEKPKRNFELERKYLSQRISDLAKELDLKKPILSNEEVAFYQREINSFILKLRKLNDAEMSLKPIEQRVRGVYDLQITSFDKQYEETEMTSINALKSQLTKEEYFTVRTPEFKSFFGDWETAYLKDSYAGVSKVINPVTKEPQPVFHGTNVLFVNWKTYDTNNAHYFAVKREFSEFFATSWETRSDKAGVDSEVLKKLNPNRGSFLLRCFIDVKNPIDFSRFGVEKYPIREYLTFLRVNYNIGDFDFWTNITTHSTFTQDTEVYAWQIIRLWQSFTKYVKVFTTYDGYIFYEYIPTTPYGGLENASLSYCAFDSNQIKFTNAYEFNALSNDSRFDLGGIL